MIMVCPKCTLPNTLVYSLDTYPRTASCSDPDCECTLTEISDHALEKRFEDCLNEAYGTIKICGYEYEAGTSLKEVDPTAFRCGLADWIDSELTDETVFERNGKYWEMDE